MPRPGLGQRAACEAMGTAFLLAAVVGSGIMAQRLAGGNGALALLCNTLPTGAILAVLILVFGPVSGAHFNPAVSIAFALRRGLTWRVSALYIVAQIVGAVAGVWLAHLMFELPVWQLSLTARTGAGQWLAEAVATFGLVLTIFGCVTQAPTAVPYAVGLYITSAYWFTASTSFANPAVTIARSLSRHFCRHRARGRGGFYLGAAGRDAARGRFGDLALAGGERTGLKTFTDPALTRSQLSSERRPAPFRRRPAPVRLRVAVPTHLAANPYDSASGVGLAAGGSIPKVAAVRQVIEKLPVDATSATKASRPIVFSAAA